MWWKITLRLILSMRIIFFFYSSSSVCARMPSLYCAVSWRARSSEQLLFFASAQMYLPHGSMCCQLPLQNCHQGVHDSTGIGTEYKFDSIDISIHNQNRIPTNPTLNANASTRTKVNAKKVYIVLMVWLWRRRSFIFFYFSCCCSCWIYIDSV